MEGFSRYTFGPAQPRNSVAPGGHYCSGAYTRQSAGLSDVRLHDLRHSFASFLVNAGRSLYEVQKILGHTQIKTTQRYAHLAQETLLEAANTVARTVPMMDVLPHGIEDVPLVAVGQ